MKYITSLLFAVLLLFFNVAEAAKFVVPGSQKEKVVSVAMPKDVGKTNQGLIQPIIWRVRKGETLTRIAERYNLTPEIILQKNVGNICIKNRDLILANCGITIPVFRETEVQVVQRMDTFARDALGKQVQSAQKEAERNNTRFRSALVVSGSAILLLVLILWFLAKTCSSYVNENRQLEKRLKDEFIRVGALTNREIALKEQNRANEGALAVVRNKLSVAERETEQHKNMLPGSVYELESRENGTIKLKVLRVDLMKDGKLEFFVGCPVEGCDLHSKPELKKNNALSHIFKNHGTTETEWAGNGGNNV